MALPQQVQAQLDQANRTLEEINKPVEFTAPPPELKPTPEPTATAPQATPEPPVPAAPVVETPPKQEEKTWEERYKALKGMYNKQVPELQQKVSDLSADLEKAMRRLDDLAAAKPQPQEPAAPVADPQDVEAFGEDLVNMVKRTAERMFGGAARAMEATLSELSTRLTDMERRLEGTTQTALSAAEQAFFDRLTKLVPDWEAVNEDDRFKAWCLEVDPVYGVPRQRALKAAQDNLDADRVAAALSAYLAQTSPPSLKAQTPPVDTQVSPRAAASAPPPVPPSKPVITAAQVDQFYRDVAQGRYRGREAEQQRLEQVINDALAEGRIR